MLLSCAVLIRDSERVLKLKEDGREWHAALLIPGEKYLLTGECPAPSPPGTKLPKAEVGLQKFVLRIEAPEGSVVSMAMGRLTASGSVCVKDGWITVPLRSLAQVRGRRRGPDARARPDFGVSH